MQKDIEKLGWMIKEYQKEVNRMYDILIKQVWKTIDREKTK